MNKQTKRVFHLMRVPNSKESRHVATNSRMKSREPSIPCLPKCLSYAWWKHRKITNKKTLKLFSTSTCSMLQLRNLIQHTLFSSHKKNFQIVFIKQKVIFLPDNALTLSRHAFASSKLLSFVWHPWTLSIQNTKSLLRLFLLPECMFMFD